MEYTTLHNGVTMPLLGYGVFQMEEAECERCVSEALENGYRLIDTAEAYGNEAAVGRAIRQSKIAREELFVVTKLKCNGPDPMTKEAFERSLEALDMEYVDLYLIHQPYGNVFGCYNVLEELLERGAVKAIGVSNFTIPQLADILANHRIPPAVNQIEINPLNQKAAEVEYMRKEQVQPMAWGPLSQGGKNGMLDHETLKKLGNKYGRTTAQIALRWHIQRGVAAIPKSSRAERMRENMNIFDFELSGEEMRQIAKMDRGNAEDIHEDPDFIKMLCGQWKLKERK